MRNKKLSLIYIFSIALCLFAISSCSKDWLEKKPDKTLVIPKTIDDYQALLDNTFLFNGSQACGLAEISAGDFYMTETSWASLFNIQEKSAYLWATTADFYKGEKSLDWQNAYIRILNVNVILKGIEKIAPADREQQWDNVKGTALFFRAFDFYSLSQEYCVPYESGQADSELGIPLRLDEDINAIVKRSTLQQTFNKIVEDLNVASTLLDTKPLFKTRPSKQAVYALIARMYLSMEIYDKAGLYADSALRLQPELVDFSKLNPNAAYPMGRFSAEVIFHSTFNFGALLATRLIVLPELMDTYALNDYRKTIFFKPRANGGFTFKGNYGGDKNMFGGLATDEMYLIRAEASVREGNVGMALKDLNYLLKHRYENNYVDIDISNQQDLLTLILKERRKEILYRGVRWSDLRRLNKDSRYAMDLTRTFNNKIYVLPAGDKKYVMPIDETEIRMTGIQQNQR